MNVSLASKKMCSHLCRIPRRLILTEAELPGHFLVWLASPEGQFLKGKFLWVNWDVDELISRKAELIMPEKLVTGLVGWA